MSTVTLTLELPDDLAERLAAMDPERRQRFAVAALASFDDLSPTDRFLRQRREEDRQREDRFRRMTEERRAHKAQLAAEQAQEHGALRPSAESAA